MKNALFDLNGTLVKLGHSEYVKSVDEALLRGFKTGDLQAFHDYEHVLEDGLKRGLVKVEQIRGTKEGLAGLVSKGIQPHVFSTCREDAIRYALEQADLAQYIEHPFSTFTVQQDPRTKSVEGFRGIQRRLGKVVLFADDKVSELNRAQEGLGKNTHLYLVGDKAYSATLENSLIVPVPSVGNIHTMY